MKKLTAVLLLSALLLTGCGSNQDATDAPENLPTDTLDVPAESFAEAITPPMPMITVSVPIIKNEITSTDGTVIFRDIRQSMQLVMPDQDVADKIIIDFLTRIDQLGSASEEIAVQAQGASIDSNALSPYLCSVSYAPMRIDQSVLSLYGNTLRYSGGAHAEYVSRAANYNTVTGDVLTLGSILVDASSLDQLRVLVVEQLNEVREEKYLRTDFEDTVQQRFNTEESYDENWYFSNTGLCFYFDHYSIAPYSSGVITAEIPYKKLIGIIDDAFFPPEFDVLSGSLFVVPVADADMSLFNRISELILNAEAPMYVIYAEDTVQNLHITLNDAVLNNYYTVFAAQSLSEGDAIVVQAETNLFRQLNVSYETSGETVKIPLITE